jgi:membrane associated rhomboid family serine protease
MFPLRDENPTIHRSIATFVIVGINAIVWIFIQGLGSDPALAKSVITLGLIPGELLGNAAPGTKVPLGEHAYYIIGSTPNYFTLITHMFMHGGWFHIIGNMWFLLVFGDNVEDAMGSVRFVIFYLLCGLASAGAQIFSDPGSLAPMVGASGAIGGVMGAYAMLFPKAPVHTLVFLGFYITRIYVPAFMMLGYWFLLQIVSAVPAVSGHSGVAIWGHIGGFLAGITLVHVFKSRKRLEERREALERWRGWRTRHYEE